MYQSASCNSYQVCTVTEQNLDSGLDCGLEPGLNRRLRNWTRLTECQKYTYTMNQQQEF